MSDQYNAQNQQAGYGQPQYMQNSPEQMRGQQFAQTSMILGILSLFVVGFVLGPIAISKANQAEKLHTAATVGKVTGWIGTVLGILGLIGVIIYFVAIFAFIGDVNTI